MRFISLGKRKVTQILKIPTRGEIISCQIIRAGLKLIYVKKKKKGGINDKEKRKKSSGSNAIGSFA